VRIHPRGVEDAEAMFLDRLAATQIIAPRNVATTEGDRWTVVTHPGVPTSRVCTLFTWLEGSVLRDRLDEAKMVAAGQLLAELHDGAATIPQSQEVPAELQARNAIYFGTTNLVRSHASEHGSLFREAEARVEQEFEVLWRQPGDQLLLHGDFGPHNILSYRGSLRPIDFQDLRYGFDVHDLGITLADLRRATPRMVQPFLEGYGRIRALPDLTANQLAIHAAARSLNIMNLALLAPSERISQVFGLHAARVASWMADQA